MSRNADIFAVACIIVFSLVSSAVSTVTRLPLFYGNVIEQRLQDRIEPQLMRIHERIEQSIECGVEKATTKLRSY
ncbi:MAG: hypothetical protein HY820_25300 [Acidobacteria bacterium]|nr:hypothetical protein [Acidobacteriota bacterium]